MNQIEEHKKLVEFLHDVYVRKNHDYGDSFSRSFGKYGVTAALVRMEDKWNRLENLAAICIFSIRIFIRITALI